MFRLCKQLELVKEKGNEELRDYIKGNHLKTCKKMYYFQLKNNLKYIPLSLRVRRYSRYPVSNSCLFNSFSIPT